MDTLAELKAIIAFHQALPISNDKLLEIVAIESFKLGANAGRTHEKKVTNDILTKIVGN